MMRGGWMGVGGAGTSQRLDEPDCGGDGTPVATHAQRGMHLPEVVCTGSRAMSWTHTFAPGIDDRRGTLSTHAHARRSPYAPAWTPRSSRRRRRSRIGTTTRRELSTTGGGRCPHGAERIPPRGAPAERRFL